LYPYGGSVIPADLKIAAKSGIPPPPSAGSAGSDFTSISFAGGMELRRSRMSFGGPEAAASGDLGDAGDPGDVGDVGASKLKRGAGPPAFSGTGSATVTSGSISTIFILLRTSLRPMARSSTSVERGRRKVQPTAYGPCRGVSRTAPVTGRRQHPEPSCRGAACEEGYGEEPENAQAD